MLDGAALPVGPGYTGEWTDASGLVNLRFRNYDPSLQRFLGRDAFAGSATMPATWNRFAYANANPLTYTDPTGHFGVARMAFSFGLQTIHGIGDLYSGLTGFFGTDWIAGYDLSDGDRILAIGAALPGPALHLLGHLGNVADDGVDVIRGGTRAADDFAQLRSGGRLEAEEFGRAGARVGDARGGASSGVEWVDERL